MGTSQYFTSDQRIVLVYYYYIGVDPRGFVCGNENLSSECGDQPQKRSEQIFDDYPKHADIVDCQKWLNNPSHSLHSLY